MPVVAIAGGTGSVGRFIVEEIVVDGKLEVILLSHKFANLALEKELGARILPIDYSDPDTIANLLEENHVDVVIAALGGRTPPEQEHGLIQAAAKSKATKRYIPSVWGVKWRPEKAAIPGNPNQPAVFTYTKDVAKFTAKLLTLEKWEPVSYIIGDRLTWKEFTQLAEEVTGDKFEITYDSVELLESGKVTELPGHIPVYPFFPKEALQGMLAELGILFDQGIFGPLAYHL
uniref:NAD(P)-binding domain-containing protein n=1 Tax=Fusarium oxysporum (strain Fo5176) TaxID=660025 RepID=A0A0D2YHR5_FUSOF